MTTLTATLPDGTVLKRRTDRDYKFVVAKGWPVEAPLWIAVRWTASEATAKDVARAANAKSRSLVVVAAVDSKES